MGAGAVNLRVLLTNDDGIGSKGIRVLRSVLMNYGFLVDTVAPAAERSGAAHSVTVYEPIMINRVSLPEEEGGSSWAVSGTPVDCVKLGVEAFLPTKPDLVISGINKGPNFGVDIRHSGTVAAAMEATALGIPAMAISVPASDDPEYESAALAVVLLARNLLKNPLPDGIMLNVNVPSLPAEQIEGIKVTTLGAPAYGYSFDRRMDPRGRVYYWMTHYPMEDALIKCEKGTDVWAVRNRFISVTPIDSNPTAKEILPLVSDWSLGLEGICSLLQTNSKGGAVRAGLGPS